MIESIRLLSYYTIASNIHGEELALVKAQNSIMLDCRLKGLDFSEANRLCGRLKRLVGK